MMSRRDKTILNSLWHKAKFDKLFFVLIFAVVILGFFIFLSASLGLQARGNTPLVSLIINQGMFGLVGGSIAGFFAFITPLDWLKKHAVTLFIVSIMITLAVFIPGLGFTSGGATRWLDLGPLTFQPAEALKIGAALITAAWFSFVGSKITDLKYSLGAVIAIIIVSAIPLLLQPDTGTPVVIAAMVGTMYVAAGAKWQHILSLVLCGVLALGLIIGSSEYRRERIMTFLNPSADELNTGYQTQQSLIAVGSGQIFGRGPGQSIQKFNYLPEPISDSIFAVYAEEYGFVGSLALILLYSGIGFAGFRIAINIKAKFERLLVVGLVSMILVQSILNIGAMVGVFPLSGMPLIFVSHGGTALLFSLVSVGLILQASTKMPKRKRSLSRL